MGNFVYARAPPTPELLWRDVQQLHLQGNINELRSMLENAADKARSGGVFAHMLFGIQVDLGDDFDDAPVSPCSLGSPRKRGQKETPVPSPRSAKGVSKGTLPDGAQLLNKIGLRRASRAVGLLPQMTDRKVSMTTARPRSERFEGAPTDREVELGLRVHGDEDDKVIRKMQLEKQRRDEEDAEQPQQVPAALTRLGERLSNCTHMDCKIGLLDVCEAAGSRSAFTLKQRLANQEAMAIIASKTVIAAFNLAKRMVLAEDVPERPSSGGRRRKGRTEVGTHAPTTAFTFFGLTRAARQLLIQATRAYCRSSTFRRDFIEERRGEIFLMAIAMPQRYGRQLCPWPMRAQATTKDTASLVGVLAAFRTIVEYEVSLTPEGRPKPQTDRLIQAGYPRLLREAVAHPDVDPTVWAEVSSAMPWIVRVCGVGPVAGCGDFLLQLVLRDGVCIDEGPDGSPVTVGPTGMVLAIKALCFLVRMDDALLMRLRQAGLPDCCRRLCVAYGDYDAALYYSVLILERIANDMAVLEIDEYGEQELKLHEREYFAVLDALGSALRRMIGTTVHGHDPLADGLGKVCWLLNLLSKKQKHKVWILCHGCPHIIGKEVFKKPDLPDWILVPCIELIGGLIGYEAQAMFASKQLHPQKKPKEHAGPYKLAESVLPLCRILENAGRGYQWPNARLAEATLGALLRLTTEHGHHASNASRAFTNLEMSDVWKWENAKKMMQKERERRAIRTRIRRGDLTTDGLANEAAWLAVQEVEDYNAQREQRATRARQEWDNLGLDFPLCIGVTWECNWFEEQCDINEALVNATKLAHMFRVSLDSHADIAKYNVDCNVRAMVLQKWWKHRMIHKKLREATVERLRNQQAALLIQTNWRGRRARKQHEVALAKETKKRISATFIQTKWREFLAARIKGTRCMFDFVCDKLGRPRIDVTEWLSQQDAAQGIRRQKKSHIIELDYENFYDVAMSEDPEDQRCCLVLFFSPYELGSRKVIKQYEQLARYFKDDEDVVIAAVNGEDNPSLKTRFEIEAYPGLIWITEDNDVVEYDAEWPRKPMTILQMVQNFVAIEIQRSWRGIRVRRAYLTLMERIREQVRMVRKKNIRVACEAGDIVRLEQILEEASPNDLTDTGELPLNIAIRKCNKETFATLIRHNADVNQDDEQGHTALFYATAAGMNEVVRLLIKIGADPRHVASDGKNLLHVACEAGSEPVALLLLSSGLEQECFARDKMRHTPLDYALVSGLESVAMRLMLKGVPVHRKMEQRMLFHALIKDMTNVAKVIIQQGLVDLNARDQSDDEWTPLHYAAASGQYTVLAALLAKGVDPVPMSTDRQIPLHLAAKNGHGVCCDMLLSCMSAALEVTADSLLETYYDHEGRMQGPFVDAFGNTVLHYACNQESLAQFAEQLVREVEAVSLPGKNHCGNTPLHFAASKGLYFVASRLAEILISCGQPEELNDNGNTPLHLAVMCGHRDVVCMLLDLDAQSMDITDPEGNTLLHFACATKTMGITEACLMVETLLAEYEHPPNVMNDKGATPLHIAAAEGRKELVELLLRTPLITSDDERVVFINAPDNDGNTSLHYACRRSRFETEMHTGNYMNEPMIKLLVEEGGDPNLENVQGYTPRSLMTDDGSIIERAIKARAKKVEKDAIEKLLK